MYCVIWIYVYNIEKMWSALGYDHLIFRLMDLSWSNLKDGDPWTEN